MKRITLSLSAAVFLLAWLSTLILPTSVTYAACPTAVTGLTAVQSLNSIVLEWDHNDDFDLGYRVWRSQTPYFTPSGAPLATINAPTNSHRDQNNLMVNTNYYYIVEGLSSCSASAVYSQQAGVFHKEIEVDTSNHVANGLMNWAQTPAGASQREVLLQWFAAPESDSYTVYRQEGGGSWDEIATTGFAADPEELATILEPDLEEIMSDLDVGDVEELYKRLRLEPITVQMMARQYNLLALATGRGFIDTEAPSGDLAYYISTDGSTPALQSICVPEAPETVPLEGFRQSAIIQIPSELGIDNSARPLDAEERYDWFKYQEARRMDGRVHMLWDERPFEEPSNPDPLTCLYAPSLQIAGYNVYRDGSLTSGWELANPVNPSGKSLLVTIPADPDKTLADEPYYFVDNLLETYPNEDLDLIYDIWSYQLCRVDWLGNEFGECATLEVPIRELDNPAPVYSPTIRVQPDHSFLTLEWQFYDPTEHSTPVTFVVARHLTPTEAISKWTTIDVVPFSGSANVTQTFSLIDVPPLSEAGRPFWYQIQVRDDAGNWSPVSSPVPGALYPRQPLTLDLISYNEVCANNTELPLTLNTIGSGQSNAVMDARAKQAILYRSFDRSNWRLIERFKVENGSVTLTEDFETPVPSEVYYRIELLDGHGNVSPVQEYCTVLSAHTPPVEPNINTTQVMSNVTIVRDDRQGEMKITSIAPAVGGVTTTTETVNLETYTTNLDEGECRQINVTHVGEDGQESLPITRLQCHNNNFLNTNRQLTNLGPVVSVTRTTHLGQEVTEITLLDCVTCDAPYAAAFRRTGTGNWMQVTPITVVTPYVNQIDPGDFRWRIYDQTDLTLNEDHEYVVVAFSRNSYEMLGYWEPVTLPAPNPSPSYLQLEQAPMLPVPTLPSSCHSSIYAQLTPNDVGLPETIILPYEWFVLVDYYWLADDPNCPMGPDPDPDHLYGEGFLIDNNGNQWPITFIDIALSDEQLVNGRLSTYINFEFNNGEEHYVSELGQIEFTPDEANVNARVILPPQVKLIHLGTGDRSHIISGTFPMATPIDPTTIGFGPLALDGSAYQLLDENLPWFIQADGLDFSSDGIDLLGLVTTQNRLTYGQPNSSFGFLPTMNNLGYLRFPYEGSNVGIDMDGLNGSFDYAGAVSYVTSFPGGVTVSGEGMQVQVNQSQISGGTLSNADALLPYFNETKIIDYIRFTDVPTPSLRIQYRQGQLNPLPIFGGMTLTPPDGQLSFGTNGRLLDDIEMSTPLQWTAFETTDLDATLFVAPASFPYALDIAPQPIIKAWDRLPDPTTGGDFDPGVNVNGNGRSFLWDYYGAPAFTAGLDLYLRRGGVSENAVVNGGGSARTNAYGYQETLVSFSPLFVDNRLQSEETDLTFDLYLPYPSSMTLPLEATSFTPDGVAQAGDFRVSDPLVHRYWNFEQTPLSWNYSPMQTSDYGNALPSNWTMLFNIKGIALMKGLNPPEDNTVGLQPEDNIELPINSEWLPTGDIGNIDIRAEFDKGFGGRDYLRVSGFSYALSDIKLSRYYSDPADTNSLPSTFGIEQRQDDMLNSLDPAILNFAGDLTPQSLKDCSVTPMPNMIGCGFTILDGEGNLDYFGEIAKDTSGSPSSPLAPTSIPVDIPLADFPIASTNRTTITVKNIIEKPSVHWAWPIANDYVDEFLPGKLILSCYGGVFAYVQPNFELLPIDGLQFVQGDFGAVAKVGFGDNGNYEDKVGLFVGYTASQAAFRALAMNRPLENGDCGTISSDSWNASLRLDLEDYAQKFGYTLQSGNGNDVVDLANILWPYQDPQNGNPLNFEDVYKRLEYDIAQDTPETTNWIDGDYNIAGLQTGDTISSTGVVLERGLGQAVFHLPSNGQGLQLDSFFFGTRVNVSTESDGESEELFKAERLSMEYNRDGEIKVKGKDVETALTGDYEVVADFTLIIGTKPGFRRVEGGITVDDLKVSDIQFRNLGAAFGAGEYNNEIIGYIGLKGEGVWSDYRLGGAILAGKLPKQSDALTDAGFGTIMKQLDVPGAPPVFLGLYLNVSGDIPLYNDALIDAKGSGSIAFWYFKNTTTQQKTFGGELNASVYATVAKIVSGRGTLGLVLQSLLPDAPNTLPSSVGSWPDLVRKCDEAGGTHNPNGENCFAMTGSFWIAAGVGSCEPNTWTAWNTRWWSDDWCAQAGAIIGLGYMTMAEDGQPWAFAYELDFENPFSSGN